jgi:hypothetical protein
MNDPHGSDTTDLLMPKSKPIDTDDGSTWSLLIKGKA